jgi:hypothetical protein
MNRYRPNEPTSPVSLDLLSLLIRADDARLSELVLQLPEPQRAELALHCFSRSHMRALGLRIARDCSRHALESVGGTLGLALAEHVTSSEAFDAGPSHHSRKRVTLARFAA